MSTLLPLLLYKISNLEKGQKRRKNINLIPVSYI